MRRDTEQASFSQTSLGGRVHVHLIGLAFHSNMKVGLITR